MYPFPSQRRTLSFVIIAGLLSARIVAAGDEPALTKDQMKQFLLTAKVIKSAAAHKGISNQAESLKATSRSAVRRRI